MSRQRTKILLIGWLHLLASCGARTELASVALVAPPPDPAPFLGRWNGTDQILPRNHPYCAATPNPTGNEEIPRHDGCTAVIGDSAIAGQLSIVLAFNSNEGFDDEAIHGTLPYTQLRVESSGRAVFVNEFTGVDVLRANGSVRFTGAADLSGQTLILRLCFNTRTADGRDHTRLAVECRLRRVR